MSGRKSNTPATGSSELTSAGLPWSEVSDFALPYAEWLDGRHVSAEDTLPSVDEIPIPAVLLAGWRWAKWPNGEVGWLSADTVLPDSLRVRSRNDIE